jgi:hypothetical protein
MVSALCAVEAQAQSCLGLPSFEGRAVHLTAGGEFPDSAMAYSVGLGAGKPNGLFANLGAGQVSYDGFDGKSTLGFLEFGYQYPVSKLQFCPIVGGYFGVGPDDELARVKVTSRAATAGLAMGLAFQAGSIGVIPNTAFKLEYLSQKVDEEGVGSTSFSVNTTVLDVGVALLLYDRLSIQPIMHFPMSQSFGNSIPEEEQGGLPDPSVGIYMSVAFP